MLVLKEIRGNNSIETMIALLNMVNNNQGKKEKELAIKWCLCQRSYLQGTGKAITKLTLRNSIEKCGMWPLMTMD